MRKLIVFHILTLLAFAMVSCGNNGNAQASTEETLPEGYKAFEFTNFSISVPEEFKTTSEPASDNVRFESEAMLKLDNGDEVSSSAYIDASFMTGGAKPDDIKQTAAMLKSGQEAAGETCEEPVIDGNTILMRHFYTNDDGEKVITWRWWILSEDGKNVAGDIYFPESQEKFYGDVAKNIVKSIKIK
ncbi:MAG: hypothetical protein IJ607_02060 [Bacteroidaceae bacterium]|nr:hypothetical protein [Bacteroidaceae bacterium]